MVTVMLYVVFCPRKTALTTVVVTAISAVVGLMETAPCAQLDEPLKVSDMGTLGAPALVLPLARGSRVPLAPLTAFHC